MSITFKPAVAVAPKPLTLDSVEDSQFFVSDNGFLCQKTSYTSYSVIAKASGIPYASDVSMVNERTVIKRKIERIQTIDF